MNIIPFEFNHSEIRVIDKNGEPWFVAKDIADALLYSEANAMTRTLDADEKGRYTVPTPGGAQELQAINESGLYSAILRSRRPEAKIFKKWVTSEVLPSIRKHGGYIAGQENNEPELIMAKALFVAQSMIETKTKQLEVAKEEIKEALPKVEALDRIAKSDGSMCITNAAKDLQMRPKDLFQWLAENKWIYRRAGHASWTAYQNKIQQGVLEHKVTIVNRTDGSEKTTEQVKVTPKGLTQIAKQLSQTVLAS